MARTHDQIMAELMKRPKAEMEARMAELKGLCTCADCPTYKGTGETSLLFCALGKSQLIKKEMECFCAPCPVTDAVELRWNFYCTRGSGRQQSRPG
jgi:hypothetical protein